MNSDSSCSVSPSSKKAASGAFSLVEVVVAVGIFALAIVGVIGLLVPTSKNITDVADADSASRVINAIQGGLQKTPFNDIIDGMDNGTIFYASKDGSKIGAEGSTAVWPNDAEKFFTFKLIRNVTLSPPSNNDTAGFLAFTIEMRWPAFVQTSETAFAAVDPTQQSVMVVPAAITR